MTAATGTCFDIADQLTPALIQHQREPAFRAEPEDPLACGRRAGFVAES